MLSDSESSGRSQRESRYVDTDETIDNQEAPNALNGFTDRLQSSARQVSKGIIGSTKESVLGLVDQSIQNWRCLI